MMLSNKRQINISRAVLLEKLRENLEIHRKEYAEALLDYRDCLENDLKQALKYVRKIQDISQLKSLSVQNSFPQNHEEDFVSIIEMLEYSTDDTVTIDEDQFRAFIKNDWHWKKSFALAAQMYKTGSFLKT